MNPLIGITCFTFVSPSHNWSSHSAPHVQDVVFRSYSHAVSQSGGVPVLIPFIPEPDHLDTLLAKLDGLLLTGGPDINPRHFQAEPHLKLGSIDADKDLLELPLTRMAIARDMPILGICRGIQMLNVASGGTLYQDLPSERTPAGIKHVQQAPMATVTHSITIQPGTLLHDAAQQEQIGVNSHHHQAVKDLACDFRVTATAPDGTIEGIEHTSNRFVVGVQWHPEGTFDRDESSQRLFKSFLEHASR